MPTPVRRYVRSLGLDACVVGGAVRDELLGIEHSDEDFLVLGVDHEGLRERLARHGRVEDMSVHGQLVGVRLHPHDRGIRKLVPKGIELTPPRAERSTGPGHKDFHIVSDPSITVEEDMARRDFTVNAMARRLSDGALIDPFGGLGDLARRELHTVGDRSFQEDPLRLLRALRLLSQLGFACTGETLVQMRLEAGRIEHVSAERIGGGLAADGMGELSKLLMGTRPAAALRLALDTGVLEHLLPEVAALAGVPGDGGRQPATLDEHVLGVVQETARAGAPLEVRLAALLHDVGKPHAAATGRAHADVGAELAAAVLRRLRYPVRLQHRVTRLVREHSFRLDGAVDERAARRFLAAHGDDLARQLVVLKRADLAVKRVPDEERAALERLDALLEQQRDVPHRVHDLAIDGGDLIAAGMKEGPDVGRVLAVLLDEVLDDPARNERGRLLARARELVA